MEAFIKLIDEISKFGTEKQPPASRDLLLLEKNLVAFYHASFELLNGDHDPVGSDFDRTSLPEIEVYVRQNFPSLGYYHVALNPLVVSDEIEPGMEDAIDDLSDIIRDLLEFRWRYLNNGAEDALWYLKLMFATHTRPHLLGLLSYITQIN